MMCHRMGRPPISTIGFGLISVSSESRVPSPPARMTAFMAKTTSVRFRRGVYGVLQFRVNADPQPYKLSARPRCDDPLPVRKCLVNCRPEIDFRPPASRCGEPRNIGDRLLAPHGV